MWSVACSSLSGIPVVIDTVQNLTASLRTFEGVAAEVLLQRHVIVFGSQGHGWPDLFWVPLVRHASSSFVRNSSALHSVEPPRPHPGAGVVQDAAINFDDKVWTVARVHEYDEDTQVITFEVICLTLIPNVDLPTDPLLQGEWLCACFDLPDWVVFSVDKKQF